MQKLAIAAVTLIALGTMLVATMVSDPVRDALARAEGYSVTAMPRHDVAPTRLGGTVSMTHL
jgi:hypothetical protein